MAAAIVAAQYRDRYRLLPMVVLATAATVIASETAPTSSCRCSRTVSPVAALASTASANTLRYSNQGDLKSLDPYTLNETTANSHLGHVYEGLTKRYLD